MFSKATANFVRQIDPEGSLIHVSRLNDSQKLIPMALVVKRNRFWFWQRPKYEPTDFTLSDLLLGDEVLTPGVSEKEFARFKGTYVDKLSGKVDTEAGSSGATLEGGGTSKLQSCFEKLNKEELDVKKLLRDSSNRLVDMEHRLVQQLEKRTEVLAVVKDRIFTTNSCSVTQKQKDQCIFQGVLALLGMLGSSAKVCVKDSNNMESESDVSLDIPSGTVIAYSVLELEIKKNGHYAICLGPGTIGGFVADSPITTSPSNGFFDTVDGKCNGQKLPDKVPLGALHNGSHAMDLSALAELPQSTRWALFKKLQETLKDRSALCYLQCVLEKLCSGETLTLAKEGELSVSAILDQPGSDGHNGNGQCGVPAHLNATHLLVSAMEELPDETLSLLSKSRPGFLVTSDTLMSRLMESGEPLSTVPLQDSQTFQLVERLLGSSHIKLKRDADRLWMETETNAGVLPLVLHLSIQGLSLLCNDLK